MVADAVVRLQRPDEGERLKAFVVLAPGVDAAGAAPLLRRWLADAFTAAERPATVTFGATLPRDATGKAVDWSA